MITIALFILKTIAVFIAAFITALTFSVLCFTIRAFWMLLTGEK